MFFSTSKLLRQNSCNVTPLSDLMLQADKVQLIKAVEKRAAVNTYKIIIIWRNWSLYFFVSFDNPCPRFWIQITRPSHAAQINDSSRIIRLKETKKRKRNGANLEMKCSRVSVVFQHGLQTACSWKTAKNSLHISSRRTVLLWKKTTQFSSYFYLWPERVSRTQTCLQVGAGCGGFRKFLAGEEAVNKEFQPPSNTSGISFKKLPSWQ